MRRYLFLIATLSLFAGALTFSSASGDGAEAAPIAASVQADIVDLSWTDDTLRFSLKTPPVQTTGEHLAMAGMEGRTATPGAPSLPYFTTLIALPPGAEIDVSVATAAAHELFVDYIEPAPSVRDEFKNRDAAAGEYELAYIDDVALEYVADPHYYERDTQFPDLVVDVSTPQQLRDMRLVRLSLYPFAYNPVSGVLQQATRLDVDIQFIGGDLNPPAAGDSDFLASTGRLVLNQEQATNWRAYPEHFAPAQTDFPLGIATYKIKVIEAGIYEISRADLAAAGMDVGSVDPRTFEMMTGGEGVAFELVNDNGDSVFDSNESVRFYGWAYDGPRTERLYLADSYNIFWLWAAGTPTLVEDAAPADGYPVATSFLSTVHAEEELRWNTTGLLREEAWSESENDPDYWWWDYLTRNPSQPPTVKYFPIELPYPAIDSGTTITVSAEVLAQRFDLNYDVRVTVNDHLNEGIETWFGIKNIDVIATTIPVSALIDGTNQVRVTNNSETLPSKASWLILNRTQVDYQRLFIADNDALIFTHAGQHLFDVAGYTSDTPIIWDITDRLLPVDISASVAITGSGSYTYTFGADTSGSVTYAASSATSLLQPETISEYIAPSLDPAGLSTDWMAISFGDFMTETLTLAAHRADPDYGGLDTFVIDIEDIVNQYGYGLPLPRAIKDYLAYGLTWTKPADYVLLVGDAHSNQRFLSHVTNIEANDIPTELLFVDPFQGMVPTDFGLTLLVDGNLEDSEPDLLAEYVIGRLPVGTVSEAAAVIGKTILYEQNQRNVALYENLDNIIFISDKNDGTGNFFCSNNSVTDLHIPDAFDKQHLCYDDPQYAGDPVLFRAGIQDEIAQLPSIVNYRGHGSVTRWSGFLDIGNVATHAIWANLESPAIVISGDCLDGEFARNYIVGLAEGFLRFEEGASVAQWSSTGLGFSSDHSSLVNALYDGLFGEGLVSLGDAIQYSKIEFFMSGDPDTYELYTFSLAGDPAIQFFRPDLTLDMSIPAGTYNAGDTIDFTIDVSNNGLYPSHVVITDTLPAGLTLESFSADVIVSQVGPEPSFELHFADPGSDFVNAGMPFGATATLNITARIDVGGNYDNVATIDGPGYDMNPADNSDTVSFAAFWRIFAPIITKR